MIRSSLPRAALLSLVLGGCVGPVRGEAPPVPPPAPLVPTVVTAGESEPPEPQAVPFSVVRQHDYRIDFGDYGLEVNPADGARIIEFSLGGHNALVTQAQSPDAFGSSFWTSPQSDWSWPPLPELNALPWKVEVDQASLVLESQVNQALGYSARQRIVALPEAGAVSIECTLTNHGPEPRKVAPWQNTRVAPGGLTFYPSPGQSYPESSLKLEPKDGITWFLHQPERYRSGSVKSYADGSEGWLAQAEPAGRLLFVKVFADVPRDAQAPKEGEIVIYVPQGGRFVEVEQQGPYVELGSGQSTRWPVTWVLERLDASVAIEPGNARLVELAREMAARVRPDVSDQERH